MCKFCEVFDFGVAKTEMETIGTRRYAGIVSAGGSYRFPKEEQFKFCPNCGKERDKVIKPLSLDELRERSSKPVFLVSLDDGWSSWAIIHIHEMALNWYVATAGSERGFGDKDNYGTRWVAFEEEVELEVVGVCL